MDTGWKFVFHEEPMKLLLNLRGGERDQLFRAVARLIANPNQRPDAYTRGADGRRYSIKYFYGYAVVYWLDLLVQEFRVVEVRPPQWR